MLRFLFVKGTENFFLTNVRPADTSSYDDGTDITLGEGRGKNLKFKFKSRDRSRMDWDT